MQPTNCQVKCESRTTSIDYVGIVTFTASCFPLPKGSASHKDTHTHTQRYKESRERVRESRERVGEHGRLTAKKRSILCGALVRVLLLAQIQQHT